MTTALMPFTYEGTQLRTVVIDGDPWFVARDICNVLELPNLTMAMQRLADAEKGVNLIDTHGGKQQMAIVTEHVVRHTWGNCSHYTLTILPRGMELIAKRRGQLAVSA